MRAALTRLKRRSDFLRTAAARRKAALPGLVLQVAPQQRADGQAALRIGFTASRKVGNAVLRNRARRRLREAAAAIMPAHAMGGRDYVLIARGDTAERPWNLLLGDLEAALKRVQSWRAAGEQA